MMHHRLRYARFSGVGIWQWFFAPSMLNRFSFIGSEQLDRLKIGPEGEEPNPCYADLPQLGKITIDRWCIEITPHGRAGMGCPVVAAQLEKTRRHHVGGGLRGLVSRIHRDVHGLKEWRPFSK